MIIDTLLLTTLVRDVSMLLCPCKIQYVAKTEQTGQGKTIHKPFKNRINFYIERITFAYWYCLPVVVVVVVAAVKVVDIVFIIDDVASSTFVV